MGNSENKGSATLKIIYFLVCCSLVLFLSSIRSYPVYGKLDFYLLNGRPWWKPWRSMIEDVIQQGEQPILSDIVTSTVLRGVFAQSAVAFRFDRPYAQIEIENFLSLNVDLRNLLPVGGILLLLDTRQQGPPGDAEHPADRSDAVARRVNDWKSGNVEQGKGKKYKYRCLVNLHGFTPSWVSAETGHWPWKWAFPSELYEFKGRRGKDMVQLLKDEPPENCMVFF